MYNVTLVTVGIGVEFKIAVALASIRKVDRGKEVAEFEASIYLLVERERGRESTRERERERE